MAVTHTAQPVGYGWTTEEAWIDSRGPPCLLFIGGAYPGLKRPGNERDHSPPFSAEVKNEWSAASISSYTFMTCVETTLHLPSLTSVCDVETVNRKVAVNIFQKYLLQNILTHKRNVIHFMLKTDIRYWRPLENPLEKVNSSFL